MTTIVEDLDLPSGTDPTFVEVWIDVGTAAGQYPAAYGPDSTIVGKLKVTPDSDGRWTADLVPTEEITPSGTAYRILLIGKNVSRSPRFVEVPATGSDLKVEDLLVDPPAAVPSSALVDHAALRGPGGHLPDAPGDDVANIPDGAAPLWNEADQVVEWTEVAAGPGGGVSQGELDDAVAALEADLAAEAALRVTGDGLRILTSAKGQANGVASLDGSALIPDAQIPSTIARDAEVAIAVGVEEAARILADGALDTRLDLVEPKLAFLTVTQPVDLDTMEARVASLDAAVVLRGSWAANAGTFPGVGIAQAGDSYIVSTAGTVDGIAFSIGDRIVAILDNASTATYATNWLKLDYTDQVLQVDGQVGAVDLSNVYQAKSAELATLAAVSSTVIGRQILAAANAAAVQTLIGTVIGTDVQAFDADLDAIATGAATTAFGRAFLALVDAGAGRAALGLILGTDVYSKAATDAAISDAIVALPSIQDAAAPNDEIYFDSTTIPGALLARARRMPKDLAIVTAGALVTSTAVETSLLAATYTPAAGALGPASWFEAHFWGSITNSSGADQTFRWRLKVGATAIFDTTATTIPTNASSRNFHVRYLCRMTAGSGGTIQHGMGELRVGGPAGVGNDTINKAIGQIGSLVVDYAAFPAIDLTVQHGSGAATSSTLLTTLLLGPTHRP